MTWTYVKAGHFTTDYFPTVPGPRGSAAPEPKQMEVLKDYEYRGKKGDLPTAFMLLYPGEIEDHVERAMAQMRRANSRASELTAGGWVVFLSLLIGSILQRQSGHGLWDPAPDRPSPQGHPRSATPCAAAASTLPRPRAHLAHQ